MIMFGARNEPLWTAGRRRCRRMTFRSLDYRPRTRKRRMPMQSYTAWGFGN